MTRSTKILARRAIEKACDSFRANRHREGEKAKSHQKTSRGSSIVILVETWGTQGNHHHNSSSNSSRNSSSTTKSLRVEHRTNPRLHSLCLNSNHPNRNSKCQGRHNIENVLQLALHRSRNNICGNHFLHLGHKITTHTASSINSSSNSRRLHLLHSRRDKHSSNLIHPRNTPNRNGDKWW